MGINNNAYLTMPNYTTNYDPRSHVTMVHYSDSMPPVTSISSDKKYDTKTTILLLEDV